MLDASPDPGQTRFYCIIFLFFQKDSVPLQESNLDADDPRANYMLQAGARLCKCLGNEFIPYLGVVMPSLLRSAQLKPDVNVADASSDDEDDDDDDEVRSARKQAIPGCTVCN